MTLFDLPIVHQLPGAGPVSWPAGIVRKRRKLDVILIYEPQGFHGFFMVFPYIHNYILYDIWYYIYICFKIFKVDLRGSTIYIYIYIIIYIYIYTYYYIYPYIYIYIYIHAVGKPWFSDVSPGFRPWWQVPSHFQCVLRVPETLLGAWCRIMLMNQTLEYHGNIEE